jgi:hypothetical protein
MIRIAHCTDRKKQPSGQHDRRRRPIGNAVSGCEIVHAEQLETDT